MKKYRKTKIAMGIESLMIFIGLGIYSIDNQPNYFIFYIIWCGAIGITLLIGHLEEDN